MALGAAKWSAVHAAKWERTRAKGKFRYFLKMTSILTLLWGLMFSLKDYFIPDQELEFRPEVLIKRISINFAVGFVWGMFTSWIFWLGAERSYKAFKQQNEHR